LVTDGEQNNPQVSWNIIDFSKLSSTQLQ